MARIELEPTRDSDGAGSVVVTVWGDGDTVCATFTLTVEGARVLACNLFECAGKFGSAVPS